MRRRLSFRRPDRHRQLHEPGSDRASRWPASPESGAFERRLVIRLHPLPDDLLPDTFPTPIRLSENEGHPRHVV